MKSDEAFQVLERVLAEGTKEMREMGADLFLNGDMEEIRDHTELVGQLDELSKMLQTLKKEWERLDFVFIENQPHIREERGESGQRTPQEDFRLPLLQALEKNGGSGITRIIVDTVGELIHEKLLPGDFQLLKAGEIRWRNATMWSRYDLIVDGLMKNDSPRGVWEISEQGREYLLNHKGS